MKYKCEVCEFVYDEKTEGTNLDDLPDDWICSLCGAGKDAFSPAE